MINLPFKPQGYWKIESVHPVTGKRTLLADWFPNLILNNGRENIAVEDNWMEWCQVGTSNQAPSALDTSLQGYVAGTNVLPFVDTFGTQSVAPFYGWLQRVYRFPVGFYAGALQEVAVGWGDGSGGASDIVSRALIVDPLGNPTPVVPLITEYLDMTYQMQYHAPVGDVTGQDLILNGVTYYYILRAAKVTDTQGWASNIGRKMGHWADSTSEWRAFDGLIGSVESQPTGNFADIDSVNNILTETYIPTTLQVKMQANVGDAGWNTGAGGIRSILFRTTAGHYQIQIGESVGALGNTVPKDNTFTMQMNFPLGWPAPP